MTQKKDAARYPSLEGRAVFISGGASGIGGEMVSAFARQGARVAFIDIDATAAAQRQEAVLAEGLVKPLFLKVDVRDIAALQAAIDQCARELGTIRVLINNAASDERHAYAEVTPEYWDNSLAINLRHHFFASQHVAPGMRAVGGGSIINLGSVSWMRSRPGLIGYTTSKAAINGLTRSMARELGGAMIRVNSIVPGAILTERQARLWRKPEDTEEFLRLQSLPVVLDAGHVARMALFLGADDSDGCSGQNFVVDAGLT
jgi:NAD(P)-dependent dehydrogenase (short-subunit alcohol dehydrogenase family)